jgi:hypothetical protein
MILKINGDYKEFTWSAELGRSIHGENKGGYRIGSSLSTRYRTMNAAWGTYMNTNMRDFSKIITPLG